MPGASGIPRGELMTKRSALLNVMAAAATKAARGLVRDFGEPGEHVLTALADSGAWTRLRFRVLE